MALARHHAAGHPKAMGVPSRRWPRPGLPRRGRPAPVVPGPGQGGHGRQPPAPGSPTTTAVPWVVWPPPPGAAPTALAVARAHGRCASWSAPTPDPPSASTGEGGARRCSPSSSVPASASAPHRLWADQPRAPPGPRLPPRQGRLPDMAMSTSSRTGRSRVGYDQRRRWAPSRLSPGHPHGPLERAPGPGHHQGRPGVGDVAGGSARAGGRRASLEAHAPPAPRHQWAPTPKFPATRPAGPQPGRGRDGPSAERCPPPARRHQRGGDERGPRRSWRLGAGAAG